jgi:hypothetical protein
MVPKIKFLFSFIINIKRNKFQANSIDKNKHYKYYEKHDIIFMKIIQINYLKGTKSKKTETAMDHINKPAMIRLARRADIKMLSKSSYPIINKILYEDLSEIINLLLIANNDKIIGYDDLLTAFDLSGKNTVCSKEMIRRKKAVKVPTV